MSHGPCCICQTCHKYYDDCICDKINKKQATWLKHERLLRMFDPEQGYQEFDAGNYVFVKQWNGNVSKWQVAIYPKANWHKS